VTLPGPPVRIVAGVLVLRDRAFGDRKLAAGVLRAEGGGPRRRVERASIGHERGQLVPAPRQLHDRRDG
jgi:hypothetical protein